MRRMQAGMSTENAVRPMHDVINHAQVDMGRRHMLRPLQRRSSTLGMKFKAPNNWPTQKMAIEVAQITTPAPWPGPATFPSALSGAYWVQPPRVGPSSTKKDRHMTQNATKVVQNDIMLKCGNGISSAPVWIGMKKLPKAAKGATVSTKKTMNVACMVITCRYNSGVITSPGAPVLESRCKP